MNTNSIDDVVSDFAVANSFFRGRMISGSKSSYSRSHPNNVVVFNANVCTEENGKIWHGDLDVTRDEKILKKLAKEVGKKLYVLREMDGRFENELKPKLERAVAIVTADNVEIQPRDY